MKHVFLDGFQTVLLNHEIDQRSTSVGHRRVSPEPSLQRHGVSNYSLLIRGNLSVQIALNIAEAPRAGASRISAVQKDVASQHLEDPAQGERRNLPYLAGSSQSNFSKPSRS